MAVTVAAVSRQLRIRMGDGIQPYELPEVEGKKAPEEQADQAIAATHDDMSENQKLLYESFLDDFGEDFFYGSNH